jgi:hypothetical protein
MQEPRDVPGTVEQVARWVAVGRIEARLANCLGFLATTALRASEVSDLASRICEIEVALRLRRRST